MITSSLLTGEDVEAERDVILDEIAMHDDDPDDVVHNLFAEQAWGSGTPLGRPIAGTRRLDRVAEPGPGRTASTGRHYRPANIVIAAAGNLDHAEVVRRVRAAFGRAGFLAGEAEPLRARHAAGRRPRVHGGLVEAIRPVRAGQPGARHGGPDRNDDRRFALGVLNTALGGGTSSRLFQEVRERRGLAYSVFSFASHHADSGLVGRLGRLPAQQARRRAGRGPHRAVPGRRRTASPPRSWPAARVSCAAAWCSASRTPAPGCRGSARPSWSTTSCSASTR